MPQRQNHVRKSLEIDDISFASSSQLSFSIKKLDLGALSQKKDVVTKPINDLQVDDISMRSSLDLSGRTPREAPNKHLCDVELDLPSDGASTFRDFVPREVAVIEKRIKMRDTEK